MVLDPRDTVYLWEMRDAAKQSRHDIIWRVATERIPEPIQDLEEIPIDER